MTNWVPLQLCPSLSYRKNSNYILCTLSYLSSQKCIRSMLGHEILEAQVMYTHIKINVLRGLER